MDEYQPDEEKKNVFLLFDYDETMTETSAQEPIFEHNLQRLQEKYGKDIIKKPGDYWGLLDTTYKFPEYDREITYLQQIRNDIQDGTLLNLRDEPICEEDLKEFGAMVELAPGIKEFLVHIKEEWKDRANIEIYIISVGMKNMILGAGFEKLVDGIYSCEFEVDDTSKNGGVSHIKKIITSFSKTASIIEIAKGENLNTILSAKDYRFHYKNCIVFGDGMSDLSVFGYLRKKGGQTVGVYKHDSRKACEKAHKKIGFSIDKLVPRDYRIGNFTHQIINKSIESLIDSKRCDFPQELIHMYIKGSLENKDTCRFVEKHVKKCKQCSLSLHLELVPPR